MWKSPGILQGCQECHITTDHPGQELDNYGADLTALGGFAGLEQLLAELDVPPATEQGQPEPCVRFFRALRTAALLDATLLIDMEAARQ